MGDQFNPEERRLIERLQKAPQSDLSAQRFEAIRAQILDAMESPPVPAPRPGLSPSVPVVAAVTIVTVVVIIIIAVAGGFFASQPTPTSTAAPGATLTPTPEATEESTSEATEESTPEASVEVTPEVTLEATVESTPEATPESTGEPVVIIEGPVQKIDGSTITIYGVTIQLDPDDPLLKIIQVDDVIHVEASTGTTVITAISVTYVNTEVNVNPTTGEVWRDNGSCDHPPPDWAPANGWRRRCQGQTLPNNSGRNNGNGNNGNGSANGNKGMGKSDS